MQVGTGEEEAAVDQEVLLLGAGEGDDRVGVGVAEELQDPLGLGRHRLLRAQERGLVVERLAGHGDEHRRDAQRVPVGVLEDVGRAGGVPARVAAGLERGPEAAVREAGGVGLTLDERLAGELGDRGAVGVGLEEAVVLLGREPGQGIEDVGVVGRALLEGPVLHGRGDDVGHDRIEGLGVVDGAEQRLVDQLRESLLHHRLGEDVLPEDLPRGVGAGEDPRWGLVALDRRDRLQTRCAPTHDRTPNRLMAHRTIRVWPSGGRP